LATTAAVAAPACDENGTGVAAGVTPEGAGLYRNLSAKIAVFNGGSASSDRYSK
jgi:hypothetical protein